MIKKKVFAFLTALTCITSMSAFPASASSNLTSIDGSLYLQAGMTNSILVETDGTKLTKEMLNMYQGDCHVGLCKNAELGNIVTDLEITENTYLIHLASNDMDTLITLSRKIALELDFVKEVNTILETSYSYASWTYDYSLTPNDPTFDLSAISIPELEEFTVGAPRNGTYHYTLKDPETSQFKAAMDAEIFATPYNEYLYVKQYADNIQEKYSDVLKTVEVMAITDPMISCTTIDKTAQSIWDTAGDHNADGTVNAQDGADILQLAAELGTGARTAISSASDVNADGTVDAQDAAAVLTFAAASGSGSPLTWVEILR